MCNKSELVPKCWSERYHQMFHPVVDVKLQYQHVFLVIHDPFDIISFLSNRKKGIDIGNFWHLKTCEA